MYNFALAFLICAVAFIIGEVVTTLTKAWVPSVFVTAVVMLLGYWTVIPHDVVSDAMLIPFGSTVGIYLLITHMGTVISLKQLKEQWKVIVVCLAGLGGMCLLALVVCPMIMDKAFVISGLPPLTGGIVAATIMSEAAQKAGLADAAVFAIAMYCVQGFAGYPLTAVCLQKEGKRLVNKFRAGEVTLGAATSKEVSEDGALASSATANKKLIPPMSAKWNSAVMIMAKLGILAWIATLLGTIQFPGVGKISGAIFALLLGVAGTTLGFLDEDSLHKCNSYGIVMFALMMYIFDGLKDCTPEMLGGIIVPMVELIVIGVLGMAVLCFLAAKLLKMSFLMAFATALTALYGFPPNAIITESVCTAIAQTPDEKEYLMSQMFPAMIVGGFTTVTITSVFVAGIFASML